MKYTSEWRKDTTAPHPLFEGNRAVYLADRRWRSSVPRSLNDGVSASSRAARAVLSWGQRRR